MSEDREERARLDGLICETTATWCNPKASARECVDLAVGSAFGAVGGEVGSKFTVMLEQIEMSRFHQRDGGGEDRGVDAKIKGAIGTMGISTGTAWGASAIDHDADENQCRRLRRRSNNRLHSMNSTVLLDCTQAVSVSQSGGRGRRITGNVINAEMDTRQLPLLCSTLANGTLEWRCCATRQCHCCTGTHLTHAVKVATARSKKDFEDVFV
jgi:hypothetical protein